MRVISAASQIGGTGTEEREEEEEGPHIPKVSSPLIVR